MSFNSLRVPLDIGTWSCELTPTGDYRSPSGEWLCFMKRDELKQFDEDRSAFERYFRPNYDFRFLIRTEIDAIGSFVRDHLNVVHWNLPTDNAGIERVLKQAVKDRRLVPVVDRDCRTRPMTVRPTPAPQRWPAPGGGGFGGGGTKWAAFANAGSGPLMFNGEPVLSGPYDPSTVEAKLKAARTALAGAARGSDGSSDLAAMIDTLASAMPGGNPAQDEADGTQGLTESAGQDGNGLASDGLTPLGDAQPFEYTSDVPNDTAALLAGSEGTPGNNQAQNRQFKAVVRALGLNPSQARQLHDEISKQGLGYHEMMERGRDMFGDGDD